MQFDQIKSSLILAAKEAGLCEYEIYYMSDAGISAETLKDEISSFNSSKGGGVCFRCIRDGKMGYASSELFTPEEMRELVKRAISNAENTDSGDEAIIFGGSESYAELKNTACDTPSAAMLKEHALKLQRLTYAESDAVTDGTQSAAFTSKYDVELINSHGLELKNTVSTSAAYVQAVVNVDGESEDEFDFVSSLDESKYAELCKKTVEGALRKLSSSEIESGKYDVIFSAKQAKELLGTFSDVFSGKAAYHGMSLLDGKVGQKIAADCITIVDDPMREGSVAKTNFDGEGVATYRKNVVENGVLKTLLYDLVTAKKAGAVSTGNGQRGSYTSPVDVAPYNFYIEGGKKSLSELVSTVDRGIYVTELKGLHAGANAVTGDFSIESAGFIIENGKLGKAVKSFTVAGNFFELMKNIEDISNEVTFGFPSLTAFGAPDILVRGMSVAGK